MEKAASTGRPFLSSSEDRNTVDTMEEHGVLSTIMYLPEAQERGAGEKTEEGSSRPSLPHDEVCGCDCAWIG